MRRLDPISRLGIAATAVTTALALTPAAVSGSRSSEPTSGLDGDLTVFAAASLTDAFEAIGEAFHVANPDVDVTFSFASSSDLAGQIVEGAPADVFASADQNNMIKLVDADAVGDEPQTFATNSLAIIVEPGNPAGITGVEDLADHPDLIVVSCDPEVPIGAYVQDVFGNAGVEVEIDSFEENVRAVSEKVELGEADAGLVYATDITAAGDAAEGVEIPADINVIAEYPIATTAEAGDPELAAAFVEFVLGDGQAVLAEFGFGAPDAPPTSIPPATAPATTGP
ncbi:molybdate ABC transporter substrate-binding protein [Desertimonas flava]|jgi:molybdate transport system substrate-binding protein|uniref:molybdate ABC transporter substrate-binding protein n=1 Tax=Desertimonas flava TaxID=2064846 RepID=UPI000E34C81E|nr:molybdate ABC transporter substrate-binding protein [Desertimonas flava]